jgi:hypothetical protein
MSQVTFLLKAMKKKFNWLLVEINTDCTIILAKGKLHELGTGGGTWLVAISLNMLYHMQKLFSTVSDCHTNMIAQIP